MTTITETLNTVGQVSSAIYLAQGKTASWTLSTAGLTGYLAIERGDTNQAFETVRLVAGNDTNQFAGPGYFRFRLVTKAGAESVSVTMTDNDDVVFQVPNPDGSGSVLTATDSGLVIDTDGPAGSTVSRPVADKLREWLSPEDKGAIGNGLADDTAAFQAAMNEEQPIRAKKGATYRITAALLAVNKDVLIDLNGATLKIDGDFKLLTANAQMSNIQAISAITNTTTDLSAGTVGVPSDTTTLTVASSAGYAAGDLVKVYSDDRIVGISPSENQKYAEYAYVAQVAAGSLVLYSRLRYSYTTSPRVAKMARTRRFELRNGAIEGPTAYPASYSNGTIDVIGFVDPLIESVEFRDLPERAIRLVGCFRPTTQRVRGRNIRTSVANDAFGYVIHEVACANGRHYFPSGQNVRHVYTNSAANVPDGSASPENYGTTYGTKIYFGHGVSCHAGAWSTHADGEDIEFISCHDEQNYAGQNGSRTAFGLRGRRNKCIDCTASVGYSFKAFTDDNIQGNSQDHEFINCQSIVGTGQTALPAFWIEGDTASSVSGVKIIRPKVIRSGTDQPAVRVKYGSAEIIDPDFRCAITGVSSGHVFLADIGSRIVVRRGTIDITGTASGAAVRLFEMDDATAIGEMHDVNIIAPAGALGYFADLNGLNAKFIGSRLTMSRAPSVASGISSPGASATAWADYRVRFPNAGDGTAMDRAEITLAGMGVVGAKITIDLDRRLSDVLLATGICTATTVDIEAVTPGAFIGQQLVIRNHHTSTQPFDVFNAGSGNLRIGADQALAAGFSLRLYWDGTSWVRG